MSDTPRTDAAVCLAPEYATPEYVHGDFARELERELAAVTAERDALRAAQQWRPIETAPQDGTRIVAFRHSWFESMAVVYWHKPFLSWLIASSGSEFCGATHWMPLPETP